MTANTDSPAIRRVLLWGALTSVAVAVACNIPDTGSVTEIVSGEVEPVATSLAVLDSEDAYFEFQVAKSAEPLPGSPVPEYPVDLRSAGVSGRVVAQFVVGTEGMALPGSFVVIESNNEGFTEAVRSALPRMRFSPAELEGGTKVKQFVQQPFLFVVE